MAERSYYEILEVSPDCTQEELTSVYKKLALKYHPDKNPDGEEQFKEITKAYKVLKDPEARQMYDIGGESSLMSAFSDFFKRFGYQRGEMEDLLNWTPKKKNENSLCYLDVSLEIVYSGGCVPIEISKTSPCPACSGRGATGCSSCGETKVITRKKVYDVHVKKGTLNGQNIYFIGEGNCTKDTSPGDLIIQINVLPHPEYKVTRTRDLERYQDVSLSLAVFGGMTKIMTLDHRNLCFRIPAGVINNGTRKRIRNEGMPDYFNPERKGDLILSFGVDLTSVINNENQLSKLKSILPSTTNGKNSYTLTSCFFKKSKGPLKELRGPVSNQDSETIFQEQRNTFNGKFYCRSVSQLNIPMIFLAIIICVIIGLGIILPITIYEVDHY